ncbi:MAG: hypothetical protein ACRDT6_21725 [Micromonosporaceae bacterium]
MSELQQALAPLVSFAGVLLLIVAVGWVISPSFRAYLKYKLVRYVLVIALVIVGIALFSYYGQNPD